MKSVWSGVRASQFILFGDSLTEWAFDEHSEGFGWYLQRNYQDRAQVQCEGNYWASDTCTHPKTYREL
jgi:lysophospholipase L1-like esterase